MRNKEDWEILYTLATNEGLRKKDVRYEQAYDNIVNLFYEKDKQIDLMAKFIDVELSSLRLGTILNRDVKPLESYKEEIKQYFERKVEDETK